MKTLIHEIGVIDKTGAKHPVNFNEGLNIVTGKSSTGKSALIEIFDYCFGSEEYTVPKGVITNNASIYYICLQVSGQYMVIARRPDVHKKAFYRRESTYSPDKINASYFDANYFIGIDKYKKHLRDFFLDIDDVDESLIARANRKNNAKSATPSIRSFTSFMLQHQNLVANKHALFYRFDEKEKRDQAIAHIKIFLGLVDQDFFILSQERERLTAEQNALIRQQFANKRAAENYEQRISPILSQLYAMMGFKNEPLSLQQVLRNPQDAKDRFDSIIVPEKIVYDSNELMKHYTQLKRELNTKVAELRTLQRQESSINKHIEEEIRFVENSRQFQSPETVQIAKTTCPFCQTEHEHLRHSAIQLRSAIVKVSENLAHTKPIKAKFESSLVIVKREIEGLGKEINKLRRQISEIEESEKQLAKQKSLYESILIKKANLFVLLDTLHLADDAILEERLSNLKKQITGIDNDLKKYNVAKGLREASHKVNMYMAEIGKHFEFEESYRPINLRFSFETFDLYHETEKGEKIYLRSMGSGANWLYCHITLFLAMHQYFAELGDNCSIPSVLFLDQPTQVYFPNFKRDTSETFDDQKLKEQGLRTKNERAIDEDIKAVENLFSQLSIYCNSIKWDNGFSPQIIVTDHADDLTLSNGVQFEKLVNGNRWRTRGLIEPIPQEDE
ncbi:MAG: DUF3732 domain-containing protein [Alphaproteobacteria bacterium]|nr:DUF3732 domain-containing protein [Alphaproteobacteria bacterium]